MIASIVVYSASKVSFGWILNILLTKDFSLISDLLAENKGQLATNLILRKFCEEIATQIDIYVIYTDNFNNKILYSITKVLTNFDKDSRDEELLNIIQDPLYDAYMSKIIKRDDDIVLD